MILKVLAVAVLLRDDKGRVMYVRWDREEVVVRPGSGAGVKVAEKLITCIRGVTDA